MYMRLLTQNIFLETDANGTLPRNVPDLAVEPGVIRIMKEGNQERSKHSNVSIAER